MASTEKGAASFKRVLGGTPSGTNLQPLRWTVVKPKLPAYPTHRLRAFWRQRLNPELSDVRGVQRDWGSFSGQRHLHLATCYGVEDTLQRCSVVGPHPYIETARTAAFFEPIESVS